MDCQKHLLILQKLFGNDQTHWQRVEFSKMYMKSESVKAGMLRENKKGKIGEKPTWCALLHGFGTGLQMASENEFVSRTNRLPQNFPL